MGIPTTDLKKSNSVVGGNRVRIVSHVSFHFLQAFGFSQAPAPHICHVHPSKNGPKHATVEGSGRCAHPQGKAGNWYFLLEGMVSLYNNFYWCVGYFCIKLLYVRFLVHCFGFWRNIPFIEGMSGIQTTGPQTTNSQLAAYTFHTQILILSIQHFSQKCTNDIPNCKLHGISWYLPYAPVAWFQFIPWILKIIHGINMYQQESLRSWTGSNGPSTP